MRNTVDACDDGFDLRAQSDRCYRVQLQKIVMQAHKRRILLSGFAIFAVSLLAGCELLKPTCTDGKQMVMHG
jgi:hypothetical protein